MRRFRFSLAGLLRLRRVQEERRTRAVREKQRELNELNQRLSELDRDREHELDCLAAHGAGELPVAQILATRRALNALRSERVKLESERVSRARELTQVQRELATAARAREAVERLRQRRYEAYLEEYRRAETTELDERSQARNTTREEGAS